MIVSAIVSSVFHGLDKQIRNSTNDNNQCINHESASAPLPRMENPCLDRPSQTLSNKALAEFLTLGFLPAYVLCGM